MSWTNNCCRTIVPVVYDQPPTETVCLTGIVRTTLDIGSNGNINPSPNIRQVGNLTTNLNDIGATIVSGTGEITLPEGDYEIYANINLDFQAGQPRTNFHLLLREGATVIQKAYGHNYMRNQNDHDQASQSTTFVFSTSGGTFNLATEREAAEGVTVLDNGWIIIRKFQETCVSTVDIEEELSCGPLNILPDLELNCGPLTYLP